MFTLLPVAPFPWWQPPETVYVQPGSLDKHQLMPSTQKARWPKTTQQARAGSRGANGEGRSERSSAVWPEDLGQIPGPGSEGRCSRDRFIFSLGTEQFWALGSRLGCKCLVRSGSPETMWVIEMAAKGPTQSSAWGGAGRKELAGHLSGGLSRAPALPGLERGPLRFRVDRSLHREEPDRWTARKKGGPLAQDRKDSHRWSRSLAFGGTLATEMPRNIPSGEDALP